MGILAVIQTVLEILKGFLQWQTVLAQIQARKLVYDIDQQQLQKGRDLLAKIDAARNAGDLAAASLLLDDAQANALYAARVRSAIPDLSGPDVGVGSGVSTSPASGSGPVDSAQPAPGPEPGPAVTPTQVPAPITPAWVPSHTIPKAPYSVTGLCTWFGRNPNGTDDKGDVDSKGHDLKGAFGDETHNEQIIGLSIPIPIFHATIGSKDSDYRDVANRRYLFDVWCHETGKHMTGVWLVDLGPNEKLKRPGDMTYALATMLGLHDNAICTWSVTDTHTQKILEIKGAGYLTA